MVGTCFGGPIPKIGAELCDVFSLFLVFPQRHVHVNLLRPNDKVEWDHLVIHECPPTGSCGKVVWAASNKNSKSAVALQSVVVAFTSSRYNGSQLLQL